MGHWTRFRRAHPGRRDEAYLEWPNAKSRGASAKHARSRAASEAHPVLEGARASCISTLPRATLPLDPTRMLRDRGVPAPLAASGGALLEAALRAAGRLAGRGATGLRTEEVRRFDASFDDVTARNRPAAEFWCPHDAAFLDWRYRDHPEREHVAVAAARGDALQGYGVMRLAGDVARLMELTAPPEPGAGAAQLLAALIGRARAAGCRRLDFFATPGWRHWPLLRRIGFLPRPSDVWLGVYGPADSCLHEVDDWQCLPGDTENI